MGLFEESTPFAWCVVYLPGTLRTPGCDGFEGGCNIVMGMGGCGLASGQAADEVGGVVGRIQWGGTQARRCSSVVLCCRFCARRLD